MPCGSRPFTPLNPTLLTAYTILIGCCCIQDEPERAPEDDGVLWQDGQLAPDVMQAQGSHATPTQGDTSGHCLHQAEQRHGQGGLGGVLRIF